MTAIETLKQWFSNLKKPTQEQFWAWLDSFWHKSEKIPMASVVGLDKLVEGTASAEQLSNHLNDTQAHKVLFDKKVDKVEGKGLSANDFTNEYKEKLEGLHQVDISGLLPKGDYTGTAQDLKKQIDDKADKNHKHSWGDIEGSPADLGDAFKKVIDNIQIGGRNLLRNSGRKVTNSDYNIAIYPIAEDIKEGEIVTVTLKGKLGTGKTAFALYNSGENVEINTLKDKGNGIYQNTFAWRIGNSNNTQLWIWTYSSNITVESTIEWIKLERGNKATDWSPAPEDLDFFKGQNPENELYKFKLRPTGAWGITNALGSGIYVNFWANSSASSLEFYKRDWYSATRIGVRNSVDSNRFNDGNGTFRDLAWYDDVMRAGVECAEDTTLQKDHQNQVVFVTAPCRIELHAIENMGSVSFKKVFDNGQVTFTCKGKSRFYTGDGVFNGKKGSTAVISIYENTCYIDIRNV